MRRNNVYTNLQNDAYGNDKINEPTGFDICAQWEIKISGKSGKITRPLADHLSLLAQYLIKCKKALFHFYLVSIVYQH